MIETVYRKGRRERDWGIELSIQSSKVWLICNFNSFLDGQQDLLASFGTLPNDFQNNALTHFARLYRLSEIAFSPYLRIVNFQDDIARLQARHLSRTLLDHALNDDALIGVETEVLSNILRDSSESDSEPWFLRRRFAGFTS